MKKATSFFGFILLISLIISCSNKQETLETIPLDSGWKYAVTISTSETNFTTLPDNALELQKKDLAVKT